MNNPKEFRTIRYMKRKDINLNNCDILLDAKVEIDKVNPEDAMILRICIDKNNIIIIEFAGLINYENIRKACEVKD